MQLALSSTSKALLGRGELDTLGDEVEGEVQDILANITGARTVPRVFVDGRCIGGGQHEL